MLCGPSLVTARGVWAEGNEKRWVLQTLPYRGPESTNPPGERHLLPLLPARATAPRGGPFRAESCGKEGGRAAQAP